MIECDPTVSVDVLNVALPLLRTPVLNVEVPSLNVTDPVGVPVVDDFTVAVKVTGFPCFEGFSEEVTVSDVAALFTICISTAEVLPVKLASPPYTTVIECDPTASVDVLNVALPLLRIPVPMVVVPSLNVTDPVGVPVVDEFTVAVKITEFPRFEGFSEEVTLLDVAALFTVCVSIAEVLPLKFASPPYAAVIGCDPTASVDVVNAALPLLSVPVPSTVAPSLNVTVPVGVPPAPVIVAVNVTD